MSVPESERKRGLNGSLLNVELCRKTPGSRGRTNKARGGKRKKRLRRGRMTREIKQSE